MGIIEFLGTTAGRWVRGIAGLALAVIGVLLGGYWWILAAVGIVVFAAGVFDFCLLAAAFGKPLNGKAFRATFGK